MRQLFKIFFQFFVIFFNFCLLPSAFCLLLSAFCLLPSAFFSNTAFAECRDRFETCLFRITYHNGRVVRSFPEGTRPVIGLVLSGGGARAFSHLGVIGVLEENGIHVERIAGTSMGAIVGGLYAAGYGTKYLIEQFEQYDWTGSPGLTGGFFSSSPKRRRTHIGLKEIQDWPLFELRFNGFKAQIPSSFSSGQNLTTILSWLCLGPSFECSGNFDNLPIPFRCVATNLYNGERVVLSGGNLARAIQASSTVPLLFTPVPWDDMLLVDGGLVDHLPVSIARDMGSDFIIASAVEQSMHTARELDNILNIADQVTSIPTRQITQLAANVADCAIIPDMEGFSSTDFADIPDIIEKGRDAAMKAMPSLLSKLEDRKSSYRKALIEKLTVEHVETGLKPVSTDEDSFARTTLLSAITPGDSTAYADIAEGIENLWASGRYLSVRADIDDRSGTLKLVLTRVPQSVTMILSGNDIDGATTGLVEVIPDSDEPPTMQNVIESIDEHIHTIEAEGMSLAHVVSTDFDRSRNNLTVTVFIPRLTDISLDRNLTLRPTVILRELDMKTGDPFSLNKVIASLENLYGTNLFEWVYADVEPYSDGARLSIHVKEKKWVVARFGIRFDETDHTKGRIALSRESILGLGNPFSAILEASERNRLFMVDSRSSRIFKSYYTYTIKAYKNYRLRFLYYDHDISEDYGDDRYGAVFSIGQHMDKLGNALVQFKTETLWITTGPKDKLEGTQKDLRSIIIRSLIDSYDRYPFPRNGLLNLMYVETTSEILGGSDQFVKLFWEASMCRTLARQHTVIGSFFLGSADPSIPDIETFTLGGSPSRLNCYDWESSGAHYYADFPGLADEEKSGNRLAAASVGYRLFIPRLFYLDLTYSMGNVWKKGQTITSKSLLQGFGVRGSFATLGGPISIGWGITSKGDERVYLSAGREF